MNLCRRNYKFIEAKVFEKKRFAIIIPFNKIKSWMSKFMKDILNMDILGNGSELFICFSNLKNC